MADVENGDVLRIGATWSFEGAYEVTNVWHAKVQAGGGIDYPAASLDIQDYMEAIYLALDTKLSNQMTTDYITLSNATKGTTFGAIAWQSVITGDITTETTAPGVCLFTWARTLQPRVQIRKYLGIFCEVDMQAGLWSASIRASALNAMNIHITPYTGGPALTLLGVAYNRTLGTNVEPVSATTSAEPAYQRRRRRGRGS